MNPKISIDIASPPDRQKLVAQLMCGHEQWAEIHQENDGLTVEFYPHRNQIPWEFQLEDAIEALQLAAEKLTGKGNRDK